MEVITLNRTERGIVLPVAVKLAQIWHDRGASTGVEATLSGLLCEYAVIKYMNEVLGANPRIPFNTEYENGTDGGRDFTFPDEKATWDVKSTCGDAIEYELARKTRAAIIVGVKNWGKSFEIFGFAPLSRLGKVAAENNGLLGREAFRPLRTLREAFPKNFWMTDLAPRSARTEFVRAGAVTESHVRMSAMAADVKLARCNEAIAEAKAKAARERQQYK